MDSALEGCSADARAVLEIAAVCGTEFDLATVQHAAGLPPSVATPQRVLTAVAELEASGLIGSVDRSTTRYRIQGTDGADRILRTLGVAVRAQLHLRVATSLERSGGSPGHVADHLAAALPLASARGVIAAATKSTEHAVRRGAFGDAVRYSRLAVEACRFDVDLDPAELSELLVVLGEMQMLAGNRAGALDSFHEAIAVESPRHSELALRAALAYSAWPAVPVRDSADADLRALIERALEVAGPTDTGAHVLLMARLAQSYRWSVDTERAASLLAEAEQVATRIEDGQALAAVTLSRRLLTTAPHADDERLALSGRAISEIGSGSHDRPLALLLHFADHLSSGNLAGAGTQVSRLSDLADDRGSPGAAYLAKRSEAALALLAGQLDRAERLADESRVHGQRAEHPRTEVGYRLQLLHIAAMRGGLEDAVQGWRDITSSSPLATAVMAWAAALHGSADTSRIAVEDVCALGLDELPLDAAWLPTVALLGEAVATLELDDRVPLLRSYLDPHAHRIPTVYSGVVCLGSTHRVAGRLAAADGDWRVAEEEFTAAIAANDRLGAVLLAASSRADYARMLRRRGEPADSTRVAGLLDSALAACRSRGADALAERIAGIEDVTPTAPPQDHLLSPREVDVIRGLARGLTNKEIGTELHISAATVQRHTINLYRKIGVNGRSDAAVYAAQHDLLDD